MIKLWFRDTDKYQCVSGHHFGKPKIVEGRKVCPKCGIKSLYKKASR